MTILRFWPPEAPPREGEWPKMGVRVKIWGILMYVQFLYNCSEFLHFFQNSVTPGDPWGGCGVPGGAPPGGVPHIGTPNQ